LETASSSSAAPVEFDDLVSRVHKGEVPPFGSILINPPYAAVKWERLLALPIQELAASKAHLHIWVSERYRREVHDLLTHWGFKHRSALIWLSAKKLHKGSYYEECHETLLFASRGNLPMNDVLKSWMTEAKNGHKNEDVRDQVQLVSPGPWLELFGVEKSIKGWTICPAFPAALEADEVLEDLIAEDEDQAESPEDDEIGPSETSSDSESAALN